MQNGHDAKVHTLNPTDNGICQAKLTEGHPSNMCCAAQIKPSRKSGHGAVMRPFVKRSI